MLKKISLLIAFIVLLASHSSIAQIQHKVFTKTIHKKATINYALHLPEDYKKSKEDYPLIVFLHGAGERGNDLSKLTIHGPLRLINEGEKIEAIILAPLCPKNKAWNNTEDLNVLINHISNKYKADESRIYLTGMSMGGHGTWNLALAYPDKFAAIAPICGFIDWVFPRFVYKIKDVPTWVFHGEKDDIIPISHSERMVKALEKVDNNPKFTTYPNANHDSWTETYKNPEFYKWLFSQKKNNKR